MTEHIVLRELKTDDAVDLIALFRSVYGKTYGNSTFYSKDEINQRIADGSLRSVVAVQDGRLVGHMAMTIRHSESKVCETGNTVVHPDARGQGLLAQLGQALHERVLRDGFIGTANYPTTAHEIMQRAAIAGGGVETGVMLAYVASQTDTDTAQRREGRLAATVVYQPMSPAPNRSVCLPNRYRDLIVNLYDRLDLRRVQSSDNDQDSTARESQFDTHYNERRGSLHVFVRNPGEDLGAVIADQIRLHRPYVTYVDVPLDDPRIDASVDSLRNEAFFYCGLLPEYAHSDVLRLQAIHAPITEDFEPDLVNPDAQQLCEFIRRDAGV